jgi:hypothetical protein
MPETRTAVDDRSDSEDKKPSEPAGPLRYPIDIGESSNTRTCVRFSIRDRTDVKNDKKSIWLYAPPGLSTADGVAYGQLDLGVLSGVAQQIQDKGFVETITDANNVESLGVEGASFGPDFLKGRALMVTGNAANPFSVQQLAGTQPRSFTFTFKLVAHNSKESKTCRSIENTFRKFMYPKMAESKLHLKYPPYFKIEFWNGEGDDKNTANRNVHLPFINLCLLQSMTATYNQSSNVYHTDGRPVEVDVSLSFIESRNMTRDDLYTDVGNVDSTDYTYDYNGSAAAIDTSGTGKAIEGEINKRKGDDTGRATTSSGGSG